MRSETVYLGSSRERLPHSTFALVNQDSVVGTSVIVAVGTGFLVILAVACRYVS